MDMAAKWRAMKKEQRYTVVFAGCVVFLLCFFVPRAFRGFNTADEMYFIGTIERIYRGEKILIDEWNPTQQLCSFWIYPFYCALRAVLGSTEGIVMAHRLLALAFHVLAVSLTFSKLRRKGWGAVAAMLLFLTFAPFGIFTLSYNSIQFAVLPLLGACLYEKEHHRAWEYVLYGVLCALLVLANPFAVLLYVLYGALCAGFTLAGKLKKCRIPEVFKLRSFLLMSVGAGIIAFLFVAFVLGRGSVGEILANLPHIVGDSEHEQQGIATYIKKTTRYFYLCHKSYKYMIWGYGALFLAILLDRKRYTHSKWYLILGAVLVIPYLVYYGFVFDHISVNYQMMPLTFWGLEAYLLTKKKDRRLLCCWFIPAVLFTMVVQYATNTGIVTISAAYSVTSILSVIFLWDWACEQELQRSRIALGVILLTILIQFAGTFYLRMTYAWGDNKMYLLNTQMERGPLKNVYTTKEMAEEYALVLNELDSLNLTKEEHLLVVGVAPWIYLYTDAGCGSYSTWQVHENSTQLFAYYELHPDKLPDVIYMMHWGEDFMASDLAVPFFQAGYEVLELERGTVMQAPGRIR